MLQWQLKVMTKLQSKKKKKSNSNCSKFTSSEPAFEIEIRLFLWCAAKARGMWNKIK